MIRPALLAALSLGLCCGEGLASSFCLIPTTPDGFVALRAGPRSDARLILKMKPEDEVQIVEGRHGSWQQVRHWPGDKRLAKGYGGFTEGYVAQRFLKDCG